MGKTYKNHSCICPECGEQVEFEEYFFEDEVINCDHCNSELIIVSLKPPKVKVYSEINVVDDDDDQDIEEDE